MMLKLKDYRICYITCCETGLYCLEYLHKIGCSIDVVVTIPPELGNKYNVSGYVDVSPWCMKNNINVISLKNYSIQIEDLNGLDIDLIIVNGWSRLISPDVIQCARFGGLGIHAGHPPIGLGRSPLVWNIIYGRKDIEVYIFSLTAQADDGHLYALQTIEITKFDNARMLYEKLMDASGPLFEKAILKIFNNEEGYPQNLQHQKHYLKRTPADGLIDFKNSEIEIYNFIRAQTDPYPGAFCFLDGVQWKIIKAVPYDRFSDRNGQRNPGEIIKVLPSGLIVTTGGSPLWILEAECQDKKVVPVPLDQLRTLIGKRFVGLSSK